MWKKRKGNKAGRFYLARCQMNRLASCWSCRRRSVPATTLQWAASTARQEGKRSPQCLHSSSTPFSNSKLNLPMTILRPPNKRGPSFFFEVYLLRFMLLGKTLWEVCWKSVFWKCSESVHERISFHFTWLVWYLSCKYFVLSWYVQFSHLVSVVL